VADACRDHYAPLGPSDAVPIAPVTVAVALAEKLDTLTGFWAIDEKPTGSKDPFALRRAALGVIRLVLGNGVRGGMISMLMKPTVHHIVDLAMKSNEYFALSSQIPESQDPQVRAVLLEAKMQATKVGIEAIEALKDERTLQNKSEFVITGLTYFFHDRLKVYLRDQGIRHDVIDACLAMPGNDDLTLLVKRAEALSDLLKTDDGENLLQGFKRANNILTQAEEKDGVEYSFGPDPKLAETDEERALFAALDTAEAAITPAMQAEDFAAAMQAMAGLRAPIDAFFDAVQINAENQILRRNRLNLLHRIREICLQVADLTKVGG
jgi:glycyl-tRNA synthetase beta chain